MIILIYFKIIFELLEFDLICRISNFNLKLQFGYLKTNFILI